MSGEVQTNNAKQIWFKEVKAGMFAVGLTDEFLGDIRKNCWSIIFGKNEVKKDTPLFAVETTDGLLSVLSPVDGMMQELTATHLARNAPEKLMSAEPLFNIVPRKVKKTQTTISDEVQFVQRAEQEAVNRHRDIVNSLRNTHRNVQQFDVDPTPRTLQEGPLPPPPSLPMPAVLQARGLGDNIWNRLDRETQLSHIRTHGTIMEREAAGVQIRRPSNPINWNTI